MLIVVKKRKKSVFPYTFLKLRLKGIFICLFMFLEFQYFVSSSFPVPSQVHPSYFPKLIRAKVHGGNSEGRLHWYKMSFLKSILKQNAVYQSNFQMSRQCLQRSDIFYLTLQRFTVSTYIGDGLQSEDFQTFLAV